MRFTILILFILFSMMVYGEKIRIIHSKVTEVSRGENIQIKANVTHFEKVNYILVNYKCSKDQHWSQLEMNPDDGEFKGDISYSDECNSIVYYIDVLGLNENIIANFGSKEAPQLVMIQGNIGKYIDKKKGDQKKDKEFESYMSELVSVYNVEVITASKTAQKATDAPATLYVITEEMIKKRGYTNLEEVLEDIPGFEIQHKSTAEYENVVTVRGLTGNDKMVIMMDGYKISPTDNTPNTIGTNYPIVGVKQVEIIMGPASALYGPDAVNGIINIITKKGSDIDGVKFYGGYGNAMTTDNHFVAGVGNKEISFMLTGHFYHSDEPNFADIYKDEYHWYHNEYQEGKVPLSPFLPDVIIDVPVEDYGTPTDSYSIHGKLNYKNFEFGYFISQESHNTSLGGKPEYNIHMEEAVYKTTIETFYGKHNFSLWNDKINIQTSIWFGSYELDPDTMFYNQFTAFKKAYKYGFGKTVKWEEQLTINFTKNFSMIAGLTYDHNNSLPESSDLPFKYDPDRSADEQKIYYPGTNIEDVNGNDLRVYEDFYYVEYKNIGTYLQFSGTFFDMLSLTVGGRFDYNSRYGSTINPRAGLVLKPISSLNLKIMYGEAFLAPSPWLSYQHYGSFLPATNDDGEIVGLFGPFWRAVNPDLEPEKLRTIEGTIDYHPFRNLIITLNGYYQKLDNMIVSEIDPTITQFKGIDVSTIVTRTNKGETITYGGSLRVEGLVNLGTSLKINPYLTYSYSDGNVDDLLLTYNSKHTVKAGIDFDVIKNLKISIRGLYRDRSYHKYAIEIMGAKPSDYGASDIEKYSNDPYFLLNGHIMYDNIFNSETFILSAYVKATNILDTKHYNVALADDEGFYATPQDTLRVSGGLIFKYNLPVDDKK